MTNLLADETSLYLRQHADNPVAWQPWNETALALARQRDCPILLSVGYAACHWCHVMAHESFEDSAVAGRMNQHFVNIKVDREERPDLDRIYQMAHQLLSSQSGGWPLTIFLDPHNLAPFFSGTYFPDSPRYQMPAFIEVIESVAKAWEEQREALTGQGAQLQNAFQRLSGSANGQVMPRTADLIAKACAYFAEAYDDSWGGFGGAPKFPSAPALHFLLELGHSSGDGRNANARARQMVSHSLASMAQGGIFDQVGGGFFRYSTDRQWMIPHFEKMLYDNGLLLALYAEALVHEPDNVLFRETLRRTADWLLAEMQLPQGGYRASIDADSEGGEGAFYVWRKEEVSALLAADEYQLAEKLFGLDRSANFEGRWHLHRPNVWGDVLQHLDIASASAEETLERILGKLAQARSVRPRPVSDDKVICAWNALTIKGMVLASERLAVPAYMESAVQALDFLHKALWRDGRLCSIWDQGQVKPWGFLDDYACLLDAVLTMLEYRWCPENARFAKALADAALAFFADQEAGGFFFTPHDGEPLLGRLKPMADDVIPAGNAIMADALLRLGHLFAEPRYLEAASVVAKVTDASFEHQPQFHSKLLSVMAAIEVPGRMVVVSGPANQLPAWLTLCRTYPGLHSYGVPTTLKTETQQLLPYLPAAHSTEAQAFLCQGLTCELPVTTPEALQALLQT